MLLSNCVLALRAQPPNAPWLLCLHIGAMATLVAGKLVMVNSSPGSNKLDTAASLDLFGLAAANEFTEKMKVQAVVLLERLEAWADRQAAGMELAQHQDRLTSSFDNLLKVMDALYQVRRHDVH